jgi:hypothetical protein
MSRRSVSTFICKQHTRSQWILIPYSTLLTQSRIATKSLTHLPSTRAHLPEPLSPLNVPEQWTGAPSVIAGTVHRAPPDAEIDPVMFPLRTRPSIVPFAT